MKSNLPLTLLEAVNLICDEKDGLAKQLWQLIRHRNAAADQEDVPYHYMEVLTDDVKIVRIRQEITDVVKRGLLQCENCKEDHAIGTWHLVDRETLLKCPKCNHLTPLAKHKESYVLNDLLSLVPLPLRDLFAKEK